ncbi:MAG TPA: pyridoxamine 5'-phosphate oxidase family protein [Acidimicrobiales bacterium]|nr:pyridoxamine 5'-phosphate oxidase family protein [Acidimicrobiales bacterium]
MLRPRRLRPEEIAELLAAEVPARLATLDAAGYPHVTPIWFAWDGEAFHMTSLLAKPHVERLRRDPRAGLVIDVEAEERPDGQRPNRQVRVIGNAHLEPELDGHWTRLITHRYVRGPAADAHAEARAAQARVVISLRPTQWVTVASV